jgi:hypothetical protein
MSEPSTDAVTTGLHRVPTNGFSRSSCAVRLSALMLAASLVTSACGEADIVLRDLPADEVPPPGAEQSEPEVEPEPSPTPLPDESTAPTAPPLRAEPNEWTWVDVQGAKCANGSPTGVGINLAEDSDELLIFLQGGGACWDAATCWGPVSTSFYVQTGYSALEFRLDPQRVLFPLLRNNSSNPFNRMHMVYVPYCTGDVHSGDRVVTYSYLGRERMTFHVGAKNLDLVLARVKATFPNLRRVYLAGDSAGGFGAALQLFRAQAALHPARVDVLDDSGQPIQPDPARWRMWREAWNLQAPPDCPECPEDIPRFMQYYYQKYPENRFGLISYTNDTVITAFMGLSPLTFHNNLQHLARFMDEHWAPRGRYYFLFGSLHVGLATPTPGLIRWLQQMVDDDPEWQSRTPY